MAGDVETWVVVRPPARNRFGDIGAGGTVEFDLPGCQFAPGPSREVNLGAEQVQTDGTIYAPPGSDVRSTDRMRGRGDTYQVVGKPQDWGSAGVVIALKLITG